MIPSPYVPDNHQYKNAMDLVNKKAAVLIEEKNLKGDILVSTVDKLLNDKEELNCMKKNLKELSIPESATKIYNTISEIIDRK